jgi:hypothetical protein
MRTILMKQSLQFLFLLLALIANPLHAATPMPIPVVVAESDDFEIVGRLEERSFIFFVDRNKTNAPVLAASLEVEQGGKTVLASFRPESGDYLIADAAFLAAFAKPGEYPLSFTLIAGKESDLLTAKFDVFSASTATDLNQPQLGGWLVKIVLFVLLASAGWHFLRRRKGGAA